MHVAVAQRIEHPDDSKEGCGFEFHQSLAHLEAPELVARGFLAAIKNPQITLRVFLCSSR